MWQVLIILTDREWNKEKVLSRCAFDTLNDAMKYLNDLVKYITNLSITIYNISFLLEEIKK